jgi:hypothetical protein
MSDTSDTSDGPTEPPTRFYRLRDGRTLGWGGSVWRGHWVYGDAVFAARPLSEADRGAPAGPDGSKLAGGWVRFHRRPYSPPSSRTPTRQQGDLLGQLPAHEFWIRSLGGNRQRTVAALCEAGWVYWSECADAAMLKLTGAGETARERYLADRSRALGKVRSEGSPQG